MAIDYLPDLSGHSDEKVRDANALMHGLKGGLYIFICANYYYRQSRSSSLRWLKEYQKNNKSLPHKPQLSDLELEAVLDYTEAYLEIEYIKARLAGSPEKVRYTAPGVDNLPF